MAETAIAATMFSTIGILSIPAGLLSLITLVPPIRRFGRASWINRIWLAIGYGFAVMIPIYAFAIYMLTGLAVQTAQQFRAPNLDAVMTELWLRTVVPPPLKQDCYSTQTGICRQADYIALNSERILQEQEPIDLGALDDNGLRAVQEANDLSQRNKGWKYYLTIPGFLLIPSLFGAAVGVVIITTLPKDAVKSRDEGKKL